MQTSIRLALILFCRAARRNGLQCQSQPKVIRRRARAHRGRFPRRYAGPADCRHFRRMFLGIQAVFQHVKGVISATSGYSGGSAKTAEYETVSTGETGHAESVQIVYDPRRLLMGNCCASFLGSARSHAAQSPGPDQGTQYRSSIFYASDEQKRIAEAYIDQLDKAGVFPRPIVTKVVPLQAFYPAEAYHQNYATLHPNEPYILYNDAPRSSTCARSFPTFTPESSRIGDENVRFRSQS